MRIRNVLHKGLRRFIENDDKSGIQAAAAEKLRRMISFLQDMESEDELRTVPGWTRYIIAQQMLERFYGPSATGQEDISRDFQAFLNRIGSAAPQSQADRGVAVASAWHGRGHAQTRSPGRAVR